LNCLLFSVRRNCAKENPAYFLSGAVAPKGIRPDFRPAQLRQRESGLTSVQRNCAKRGKLNIFIIFVLFQSTAVMAVRAG
jgi:hypothetical protein